MSPMPRAARAPHSSKVPDACPHCGSHVLTRRGTRRKKLEIVQLWRCASCKRTFTPGPAAIRNKTYPLRTVHRRALDLQSRLLARGDGRAHQIQERPHDRRLDDRGLARAAQAAHELPAAARPRPAPLPSRADHPLHQAVSPANLRLRVPPTEAGVPAPRRARRQAQRRHALRSRSRISSRPCRSSARTISSAPRTAAAHRRRIPRSPTSRASSSTARRTSRRASPASSFRPSATTSCVTRRCSSSC